MMETYDISVWKEIRTRKSHEREARRVALLKEVREKVFKYFTSGSMIEHVYITGSLLQPDEFHKYSDIDLAIEGLPETSYLRTKVELEKLLNVTVDLIELESCPFKEKITENGLKIL